MRHHFHRCPSLRVITADASELNGARRGGSIALDELCEAKGLVPCMGLLDCDVLAPSQKRTLLVSRATQLRARDGGTSELADGARPGSDLLSDLRRELVAERARIFAENRRIEAEVASLLEVGRDGNADEVDRGDAAAALRFDDALEKLSVRRLDTIDQALDAMERGTFGFCRHCDEAIEPDRLRAVPDASMCITCARRAEARA
jgi:RNA polymerase-binding transcription factor DksA